MRKPIKIVLITLLVLIALFPYAFFFWALAISAEPHNRAESAVCSEFTILSRTNIRQGNPEILYNRDTHGGFLGDGDWYAILRYGDDSLLRSLADNPEWRPLPLTDTLSWAVECFADNGRDDYDFQTPLLAARNGYYFFLDRQKSADNTDPKDDGKLKNSYSYNFTLAVYDADTATLYIWEIDT